MVAVVLDRFNNEDFNAYSILSVARMLWRLFGNQEPSPHPDNNFVLFDFRKNNSIDREEEFFYAAIWTARVYESEVTLF
jgi:hypothetical protein